MVSSAAFRAFSCERFDTGREFLRADFSVECSTATHVSKPHEAAKDLAMVAIMIYPVGISVMYMFAFAYTRPAIRNNRHTKLSQAISFLSQDFEPDYLWWELIESWKKLTLVGFFALLKPGSILQVISAFVVSVTFLLLISVAMPYKDTSDDYFAKACSYALTMLFFFVTVLKMGVLTEQVDSYLTDELRYRFSFDAAFVSGGMIISIVGTLPLAAAMAAHRLLQAARVQEAAHCSESSAATTGVGHSPENSAQAENMQGPSRVREE